MGGDLATEYEPSKRRTELGVMVDILTIASEPVRRTKILYRANLSYRQMVRYLDLVINAGLLAERGGTTRFYQTTKKGVEFLATFGKCDVTSMRSDAERGRP